MWRWLQKVFGAREAPEVATSGADAVIPGGPADLAGHAADNARAHAAHELRLADLVVPAAADDIGATPEATALQAAIAATPDDAGPQLVLADLLLGVDDPRGELIVLHQRELAEGLHEPEALLRYLFLGALYSFPRALPEDPVLPFGQFARAPLRYRVTHAGVEYVATYEAGRLEVGCDGTVKLQRRLALTRRDAWTPDEESVLLRFLSDAIRAQTPLGSLQLPFNRRGSLPRYDGGPVRCYRVPEAFTRFHNLGPLELGLAARDYYPWLAGWRRLAPQLALER